LFLLASADGGEDEQRDRSRSGEAVNDADNQRSQPLIESEATE